MWKHPFKTHTKFTIIKRADRLTSLIIHTPMSAALQLQRLRAVAWPHFKRCSCEGSAQIIIVAQPARISCEPCNVFRSWWREVSRHHHLWHVVSLLLISISAHRWQMRRWQVSEKSRAGLVSDSLNPLLCGTRTLWHTMTITRGGGRCVCFLRVIDREIENDWGKGKEGEKRET